MASKLLEVTPVGPMTFFREYNNAIEISVKNIAEDPVLFRLQSTVWGKFKLHPRWAVLSPQQERQCSIRLVKGVELSKHDRDRVILVCMTAPINSVDMDFTSAFWRRNICYDPMVEKHSLSFKQSPDADQESVVSYRTAPIHWR